MQALKASTDFMYPAPYYDPILKILEMRSLQMLLPIQNKKVTVYTRVEAIIKVLHGPQGEGCKLYIYKFGNYMYSHKAELPTLVS